MNRPLLILDLDETLVHATEKEFPHACDFQIGPYRIYRRPYLDDFLLSCFLDYEVAIWTSSSSDYATELVGRIFPDPQRLVFLWTSEKCTQRRNLETYEQYSVKDLRKIRKLGYNLERVLMVDDSPEKLERSYGNHIRIKAFEGDPLDLELKLLATYLQNIRNIPNYRTLEKRFWRNRIVKPDFDPPDKL